MAIGGFKKMAPGKVNQREARQIAPAMALAGLCEPPIARELHSRANPASGGAIVFGEHAHDVT